MIFMFLTLKQHFSGHFIYVQDVKCATTWWIQQAHMLWHVLRTLWLTSLTHAMVGASIIKESMLTNSVLLAGTVIMYWHFLQLKSCLRFCITLNLPSDPASYILSLGISSSLGI
jgi:hypothetical protein